MPSEPPKDGRLQSGLLYFYSEKSHYIRSQTYDFTEIVEHETRGELVNVRCTALVVDNDLSTTFFGDFRFYRRQKI